MAREIAALKSEIAKDIDTKAELDEFLANLDKEALTQVMNEDPTAKALIQANITSNTSTIASTKANTSSNATTDVWIQPTPAGH